MQAVVGALRAILGLDTAAFEDGLNLAQKKMAKAGKNMAKIGQSIQGVGAGLSVGVTAPLVALGVAASRSATEAAQALGQVEAALKSMGGASGRSTQQLQAQAATLQHLSTFDDDDILRKVTANLLTFGNVSGKVFDDAQKAIVDISARMGTDLQSSALMVGKALNGPVEGLTALRRVGIQFTEQQQEQIKAMVAAGDVAGAQTVMLAELERQFGGSAEALRKATPGADTAEAWRNFQDVVGKIVNDVLPPLTRMLTVVLDGFSRMPEGMQTFVVGAAAVAAVIGPVAMGIGTVVTVLGALLPAMAGVAAFMTATLIPVAIATAPVWVPIAVAVAAVGAAIWALIKYWPQIKEFAANVDKAVGEMAAKVVASAQALATGIKTWIQDRLKAVFDWVIGKAKAVGDAFYQLYDKVVGHSYVPDMVDGIADEFARLDEVMVTPALAANDNVADSFQQMADAISSDIGNVFSAIKNKDWSSAVQGAMDAASALKSAFSATGTTGDKIGAVAGIANGVGQQIGGTAGSALSGAAQGAMMGFQFGGPVGAAVGGIIGGISGILSGNAAKKKAKAEAARKAAEEAAARALQIANTKRSLEVQLLEMTGDKAGALAITRRAELDAMDESLRGLQQRVYDLQDIQTKAAEYADSMAQAQAQVDDARSALEAAYDREASAIDATKSKMQGFIDTLKAFRLQLTQALTAPALALGQLAARFFGTAARAQAMDEAALGDLVSQGQDYIDASESTAKTALDHLRVIAQVRAAVQKTEGLAGEQVSIADQQLAALNASVAGLIDVHGAVLTVSEAINRLAEAQGVLNAASGGAGWEPGGANWSFWNKAGKEAGGWTGGVNVGNVLSGWMSDFDGFKANYDSAKANGNPLTQLDAYYNLPAGTARAIAEHYKLPAFANGGGFTVGGSGGIDSQVMAMRLTPGEMVDIRKPGQMNDNADLAVRIDQLRGDLNIGLATIARNTAEGAKFVRKWDSDGLPEERVA